MRIKFKNRRGSIGLEAVMIVPAALMMIFVARFVSEGMLTRQETSVYIRSSTVNAAVSSAAYTGSTATVMLYRGCKADREPFSDQSQLNQAVYASCFWRPAEQGVDSSDKFWKRSETGANPWSKLIRDVKPTSPERDVHGRIFATMQFERPDFLQRQGGAQVQHQYLAPTTKIWNHEKRPLKQASDKVIYQELRRENTHKLFPRVFPSWNR